MSYHQAVCTGVEEQVFFDMLAFALFSSPVCTPKLIFSFDKVCLFNNGYSSFKDPLRENLFTP